MFGIKIYFSGDGPLDSIGRIARVGWLVGELLVAAEMPDGIDTPYSARSKF